MDDQLMLDDVNLDSFVDNDVAEAMRLSTMTGESPSMFMEDVQAAKASHEKAKKDNPTLWDNIGTTFQHAYLGLQRLKYRGAEAFGINTPEADAEAQRLDQEIETLQQRVDEFKPSSFIQDILKNTAIVLPSLFDQYQSMMPGVKPAGVRSDSMLTNAVVGAIESVSPLGAALLKSHWNMFMLGAGGTYEELKDLTDDDGNPINQDIMRASCAVSGIFQAAVEQAEMLLDVATIGSGKLITLPGKSLLSSVRKKIATSFANAATKLAIKNTAVKALARGGGAVLQQDVSESIEEGIQKSIEIGSIEFAKAWSNTFDETDFTHKDWTQAGKEVLDETLTAMKGMLLIAIPGGSFVAAKTAQDVTKQKKLERYIDNAIDNYRERYLSGDDDKLLVLGKLIDDDGNDTEAVKLLRSNLIEDRKKILKKAGSIENIGAYLKDNGWHGTEIPTKVASSVRAYLESERDLPFITAVVKDAQRAMKYKGLENGTEWYRKAGLEPFVKGETDTEALKFFAVLAYTSVQSDQNTNLGKAIKVWQKYKAGMSPEDSSRGAVTGDINKIIADILKSEDPWHAFNIVSTALGPERGAVKVRNFAETLKLANIDPSALYDFKEAVLDFRMGQYFLDWENRVPSGYVRERINDRIIEVVKYLRAKDDPHFWTVDRVQAALWHHVKDDRLERGLDKPKGDAVTYAQSLQHRIAEHYGIDESEITPELSESYRLLHLIPGERASEIFDYYSKERSGKKAGHIVVLRPEKEGKGPARVQMFMANSEVESNFWSRPRVRVLVNNKNLIYDRDTDPDGRYKGKKPDQRKIEERLIEDGYLGVKSENVTAFFAPVRGLEMKGYSVNISPTVGEEKIDALIDKLNNEKMDRLEKAYYEGSLSRMTRFKNLLDQGQHEAAAETALYDAASILQHPMFDVVRLGLAEGMWQMFKEDSIEGVAEVADETVFLGKVAEYLKLYRQDCGYVSELFGGDERPGGLPKDQAPSMIFAFPEALSAEQRLKVQELLVPAGFAGSTFSFDQNAVVIDHVPLNKVERDGKVTRTYDMSAKEFKAAADKFYENFDKQLDLFYKQIDLPKPKRMIQWKRHHVLGEENYDKKIEEGKIRDRQLATDLARADVGRRAEGIPEALRQREVLYQPQEPRSRNLEKFRQEHAKEIRALIDEDDRANGLDPLVVRDVVNSVLREVSNPPKIYVIENYSLLPDNIARYVSLRNRQNSRGWFVGHDDGSASVIIIANRCRTKAEVVEVLMHEMMGHWGIREVVGKDDVILNQLLDDIYFAKQGEIDKGINRTYGFDLTTEEGRRKAADEWFARKMEDPKMMEDEGFQKWVDRMVEIIRQFIRSFGVDLKLSDGEIRNIMRQAADAVVNGPKEYTGGFWDSWGRGKFPQLKQQDATKALETILAMYAGTEGSMWQPGNLSDAMAAIARGEDPREVWKKHGWFVGPEGKMKFEIDDSQSVVYEDKLNKIMEDWAWYKLEQVLKHDKLYEVYPFLRNVWVEPSDRHGESYYSEARAALVIGISRPEHLLHEVQHAIQYHEGFALGGSPEQFPISNMINSLIHSIETELDELTGIPLPGDEMPGQEPVNLEQSKRIRELQKQKQEIITKIGENAYYRLAGEIESYDTQERMGFTEEQRKEKMPYELGVALGERRTGTKITRDQWIVKRGAGTSFSVEPAKAEPDIMASIPDDVSEIKSPKTRIRALSGQTKVGELQIGETEALEAAFKKAEQAARKAYSEGKKAGIDLMKVKKVDLEKNLRDTANARLLKQHKDAIEDYKEKLKKRSMKSAERSYVNKVIGYLKAVQKAVPKLPPQEQEPIIDLLNSIDLAKLSEAKRISLEKTRTWLQNHPEAELPGYVMDDLSRLDKTPLRELTIDDIKSIEMAVKHFVHLAKVKNKIKAGKKLRWLKDVKAQSFTEMRDTKDISGKVISNTRGFGERVKDRLKAFKDFFWFNQMRYDMVIETLGGLNSMMHDVLMKQISEGQEAKLRYVHDTFKEFVEMMGPFREKYGIKNMRDWLQQPFYQLATQTVEANQQDVTVSLSRGQVMALYRHSLCGDNMQALIKGGFGLRESENPNSRFLISERQVNEAINSMGSAELEFAGFPVENLFKKQGKLVGDVFYEKNGYEMPILENYYPKHVMPLEFGAVGVEEQETLEKLKGKFTRVGVPKGFTKERVGSIKGIYLNSIDQDIARSVHDASGYIGLEMPLTNASRLFYDKEFRREIESRYGKEVWQYIDQGMRDIAGEHLAYGVLDDAFHRLRANLSTSILGLRPWTMLKQVAGLGLYMVYVDPKYMVQGIYNSILHPKATAAKHEAYSPKYLERVEEGFSRDIQEVYKLLNEAGKMFGDREFSMKYARTLFMKPLQFFDRVSIIPGMEAAINQALDEMESGELSPFVQAAIQSTPEEIAAMGPEERLRLAYKFADTVTSWTQPMYNPEHRSAISRGGVFYKMLSMFSESTNAMYNMIMRTYNHGRTNNDWAPFGKALFSVLVLNAGWVMMVNWIRHKIYDEPDDERKQWDWKKIVQQWFGEASGLIYGVREIVQTATTGFESEFPVSALLTDAGKTLGNAVEAVFEEDDEKKKKKAMRAVTNAITVTQKLMGVPLDEPIRMGKAAYKTAGGGEEF